jgi:hypothetical protein
VLDVRALFTSRQRVTVLIIERIQQGTRIRFPKKYSDKMLFIGKLPVLSILLFGLMGYMMTFGVSYNYIIQNELLNIFSHAKIDEMAYQVVDFVEKEGRLMIYVIPRC